MIPVLLFALLAAAPAPRSDELYGPLFDDIGLNAWIGNGNELVALDWVTGYQLRISALDCPARGARLRCNFFLTRTRAADGEPTLDEAEPAPDRLACVADLDPARYSEGRVGWGVVHTRPPSGGGHSRTSMQCRAADQR